MGNSSCPPTLGIKVEGDQKNCAEKFEDILRKISSDAQIKHVVLAFFGNYFLTTAYAADHIANKTGPQSFKVEIPGGRGPSREDVFYVGLNNTIKLLVSNGKQVTLLIDIPELPFFPKDCIRNTLKTCVIKRAEVDRRQASLRKIISELKKSNPTLSLFDPIHLMCDAKQCGYLMNDVALYRDSHHLSVRGSFEYAKRFVASQQ